MAARRIEVGVANCGANNEVKERYIFFTLYSPEGSQPRRLQQRAGGRVCGRACGRQGRQNQWPTRTHSACDADDVFVVQVPAAPSDTPTDGAYPTRAYPTWAKSHMDLPHAGLPHAGLPHAGLPHLRKPTATSAREVEAPLGHRLAVQREPRRLRVRVAVGVPAAAQLGHVPPA